MSNKNDSIFKNRIEFIIAIMTKEYDDAEEYGRKILEAEPENVDIAHALSLLKQRRIEEKSSSDTSSDSANLTDDSDDEQRTSDDNTETDLESDVNDDSESEIKLDWMKYCQSGSCPRSDCDLLTQHLSRLTGKDPSFFNFERKLQRVIIVSQDAAKNEKDTSVTRT